MDVDDFIRNNGTVKRTVRQATLSKRLFAFIFDLLILDFFVFSSFAASLSSYVNVSDLLGAINGNVPFIVTGIILFAGLLSLAYFSLLEYSIGSTLGMMLFGLRVSGKPGFWKCVVRNIFILPVFPFSLLWVIEPIYLIWRKRRVLEEITGTDTVAY